MAGAGSVWYILASFVNAFLEIYFWIVIVAVIVSWIAPDPFHPTARVILPFLRKATEPVLDFFSRTFRLYRYTSPLVTPLVVIFAIFLLQVFLLRTIQLIAVINDPSRLIRYVASTFFFAILYTLYSALNVYFWIIIIAVIISWIPLDPYHPLSRALLNFLRSATDPVFDFFRRTFRLHRYTAPLDFTPMIVILVIYLLRNVLMQLMQRL